MRFSHQHGRLQQGVTLQNKSQQKRDPFHPSSNALGMEMIGAARQAACCFKADRVSTAETSFPSRCLSLQLTSSSSVRVLTTKNSCTCPPTPYSIQRYSSPQCESFKSEYTSTSLDHSTVPILLPSNLAGHPGSEGWLPRPHQASPSVVHVHSSPPTLKASKIFC